MAAIRVRALEGGEVTLEQSDLEALSAATRGTIMTPGDDGYETSRTIWNAMIDRHPGLVVRCIGAAARVRSRR